MKILTSILLTVFFLTTFAFDANAFILRIKIGNKEICIATGKHDCAGLTFSGNDNDFVLVVNGNKIKAEEVTITGSNYSNRNSKVPNQVELQYKRISSNSKERLKSPRGRTKSNEKSTLQGILIKNKRTGEVMSLESILKIQDSCKG